MKSIYYLTFLLLSGYAYSQNQSTSSVEWAWTQSSTNTGVSVANHIEVDSNGYIYVSGAFKDTLSVDGFTIYNSASDFRPFVVKFDGQGNALWLQKVDSYTSITGIELDPAGNLYAICDNAIIHVFDTQNGMQISSFYLITEQSVPNQYEEIVDFKIDSSGNLYAFKAHNDLNTMAINSILSKYELSGHIISDTIWSKTCLIGQGIHPLDATLSGFDYDDDANVYIACKASAFDFDIVAGELISSPSSDWTPNLFLLKYDENGNALWLDTVPNIDLEATCLQVNSVSNSLVISGGTGYDAVIHDDTLPMETTNWTQIFLTKYDLDGQHQWSKALPLETATEKVLPLGSNGAAGLGVHLADSGYIYLNGIFTGSIIFESDTLVEDTTVVLEGTIADDVFIAKFNSTGSSIWGKYAGNASGKTFGRGNFWLDEDDDVIHLVGYTAQANNLNKLSFVPTELQQKMFVGKERDTNTAALFEAIQSQVIHVYPVPTSTMLQVFLSQNEAGAPFKLIDSSSKTVVSGILKSGLNEIDVSKLAAGTYTLITSYGAKSIIIY